MRNILRIEDLTDGTVQVSWQRGNALRQYPEPVPFSDPLSRQDRKDLRWYLEEYLRYPYGAYQDRAAAIELKMEKWGARLFEQVFIKGNSDPDPRGFFHQAVQDGLDQCELCIASDDPVFLNIPWELLRDSTPGRGYLGFSLAGLYRQRSAHALAVPPPYEIKGPFRILLVIARKIDDAISVRSDARPMLEVLRPFMPGVQLDVLRPPTFDALRQRLTDQPGYYHLVQFDGHGVMRKSSAGKASAMRPDTGYLLFETVEGDGNLVSSRDLAEVLTNCRVPLFVFSACQSSEEGEVEPFGSVASQMIAVGARGVLGMSYSVHSDTTALFMKSFYDRLVNHAALSEAVAEGRKCLLTEPRRESVVGPLPLRDWMVPTLYQQESGFIPIPTGAGTCTEDERAERQTYVQHIKEALPEGRFGFIGRDREMLGIERKLRDNARPWLLIHGIGGTGKTELAHGFGRWFAETGGCPGGVYVTTFKENATFGQVLGSIFGYATDFSRLSPDEQFDAALDRLCQNPCLLVWDNFETVAGYPEGAEPFSSDEDRAKFSRFLKELSNSRGRVIVTSRKWDESWLGVGYNALEVEGLTVEDASSMAKVVLGMVGKSPEDFRSDTDYYELVKLLAGHPRSLEVVLPHLRTKSPGEIVRSLRESVDNLGESLADASFEYAFSQMSEKTRKHLPAVGLFSSVVSLDMLALLAGGSDDLPAYREIAGEALDRESWGSVLEEAARGGMLRPLGGSLYEIHPTLPALLRRHLVSQVGQEGLTALDREFMRFFAGFARAVLEEVVQRKRDALDWVAAQEANLLRALRLAEAIDDWDSVQWLAQTLGEFYDGANRTAEWGGLRSSLLRRMGRERPRAEERDRGDLQCFLLLNEANEMLRQNSLDLAEQRYLIILGYYQGLNDSDLEGNMAVSYHQLGMVAQERNRFDEAEAWYRKALEIRERLGLERDAAGDYHQLGIVAQERNRFDEAEQWYRKALEICERLGLKRDAARVYHQLGRVAEERNRFDEAEQWYRKALEIKERLGLERYTANDYHQLGRVAQERNRFDEAEQWYRKALEIYERLGLEHDAAGEYHQLGRVAQERNRFDDAEQWYRKALEIYERLGHPPQSVNTLAQYGLLHAAQGRYDEALMRLGQALLIAVDWQMQLKDAIMAALVNIKDQVGEGEFRSLWLKKFPEHGELLDMILEFGGSDQDES
ncbi:MAG: tetratricopeptide repeat protein [Desulfomonile tiedjei]|nr:tetratricopeptide repeat protein [Desulfomonile tiedjei]